MGEQMVDKNSEKNSIRVVKITKNYMIKNINKFLAIESNWIDIGEEPWRKENFLFELPLKWELSFAAEKDGLIIGYLIGSEYNKGLSRVNKIVVDLQYHRCGIGKQLINQYFAVCLKKNIKKSELKALVENDPANRFYSKIGYLKIGEKKGTDGKMRIIYEKKLKLSETDRLSI